MSQLKRENVNKCLSLLREYIGAPQDGKKESAILALDQLRAITAGNLGIAVDGRDISGGGCSGKPRVNGGAAE